MKRFPIISIIARSQLLYALIAIFFAIAIGAIGFYLIEGFSPLDSIYLATETVTTVGYGDLTPKTTTGRVFAIFFMLIGAGTVLYALTSLVQTLFQAELIEMLDSRRKIKEMEKLHDHYIVCGAGRVGKRIIRSLQKQNIPFVVIEREQHKAAPVAAYCEYVITGDATLEDTLKRAGVERAKGLASCLADDAANVYVVLTARGLNGQMHIVARAVEEEAEPKLIRAGANRVVAPTIIGSQSMARALLKPTVADFMDSIVAETLDLVFEEVAIKTGSAYAGKCLKETNIRAELNLVIVAIRRKSGEMIFQPSGEDCIEENDLLIVIGRAESVVKLLEANK
ncbi:MAG TPA: potassium channel protein [Pyrinomonadaceae bacterium]|jgi:voltage-gated potassium channel